MSVKSTVLLALLTSSLFAQDVNDLKSRIRAARAKVFPCLVHITSVEVVFVAGERRRTTSTGSGFFIDENGHVVTNFHVAGQATKLFVTLASKRKVDATLVAGDPYTDVAVLRVDPQQAFPDGRPVFAHFGDSKRLEVGDFVMAMGSPLSLSRSVSFGIISCRDRLLGSMRLAGHETGKYNTWLQTDAAINPGNSGGPLVNLAGEVIGVNTRANLAANNIGFAIPSDVVKEVVAALLEHRRVPRSQLGLKLQPLDSVEDTLLGSVREGVLVAAIVPASPAAQAGIRPGDFITRLDDRPFSAQFAEEIPALYRRIAQLSPKKSVVLTLLRGGATIRTPVTPNRLGRRIGRERQIMAWGITVRAVGPRDVRDRRLPDAHGVLVTGVKPGGAGVDRLERGDIVRTVQGKRVEDLDGFMRLALESIKKRDQLVRMILRRQGITDVTALRPRYKEKR